MDPISVISAVGTTLQVVRDVWDFAQWMQRVYDTIVDGDKTLQSIGLECKIYGESIKAIGNWLRQNQTAKGLTRQIRTTNNAITLVQVSMANLLLDLKKFQNTGMQIAVKDSRLSREKQNIKLFQQFLAKKSKLLWFQQTMSLHLVELRAHAATLQLTLGVIELTRTNTPERKEKIPGVLEDKTEKLEKRLLLRQVITKALQIRRAEVAEAARRIGDGGSGQLPCNPFPGSAQNSPQKLTFYDVVQLARQQAVVEKTQRSSEVLIDFSDTSQSVQSSAPATIDHYLFELESSGPMAPQVISLSLPSQDEAWATRHNQTAELPSNEPAVAEMDASSFPKQFVVELSSNEPSVAEMDASSFPKQAVADLLYLDDQVPEGHGIHEMETGDACRGLTIRGAVGPEACLARNNTEEIDELCASPAASEQPSVPLPQSRTLSIDRPDGTAEAPANNSPTSTAAPSSIFSHSSSLTSTIGSSLPGLTEEDMEARIASSQTSLKVSSLTSKLSPLAMRGYPETVIGSAIPSTLKSATHESDAKLPHNPHLGPTSTTDSDSLSSSKPQQTKPEDNFSLSPTLQQIPNIDEPDDQGFPWIVQAARDGNEQMVRKLLTSGADIKAFHTSSRRHALSEASIQGHQRIVDMLIQERCPLEYPDAEGNTALHHACRRGNLAVVKSLINSGAHVDALGQQGQTALHLAMLAPHQNVVMLLIQHKANVNARDTLSRTPLHIGASQGNVAMCSYLLDEGAQLDSREVQSKTPLQLACEANHSQLVQMMLQKSNLNSTGMTFLAAFFASVEHGHVQIVESFFPLGLKLQELKKHSHKPITLAAKSGCRDMVELLIQENCEVNARDSNGWNALHFASYHGHYQVIEQLLEGGVSAKATTSRKETPLFFAVKRGHFAVVERLLRSEEGRNLIIAEDEYGQQPVHHAVRAGSLSIFNLLMSYGGKINVQNDFGWQPLHVATAYGHPTLVERLLQQGVNIEEKLGSPSIKKDQTHKIVEESYWAEARWPYPGSRALHLACEYGHDEVGHYLISKGAKMEKPCIENWQPLHHAAYFGRVALVETLLEGGVNPHAITNEGKTALALEFCTSGATISEEDKERIRSLLKEAMGKTRKQKSLKVALKRGSTVEEKNRLVRTATFSMDIVSKPPLHRATTIAQPADPISTVPDLMSTSLRPRFPHYPHTSPLPTAEFPPIPSSNLPPTPHQPASQAESRSRAISITSDSNVEVTDPSASPSSSLVPISNSTATHRPLLPETTSTPNLPPSSNPSTELSPPPEPKLKRRTTFGLRKPKPSMDIGKLNLGNMGKPTFEIGKSTLELGNKTLGYGKQGIEMSKQRFEALQGLEMGKQGLNMSKQGYEKAKKLARKGRLGKGKAGEGSKAVDGEGTAGGKDGETGAEKAVGKDGKHEDWDDDDDSDDARSQFSLGDFAEVGNHDY